ncbi:hypothetical protein [Endozoicomonas atrinae]|uniref:hypothetical protein n=1 Tax=Endozoicomonas atrinae TaxID=1333660 RepID=UPI003B00357C
MIGVFINAVGLPVRVNGFNEFDALAERVKLIETMYLLGSDKLSVTGVIPVRNTVAFFRAYKAGLIFWVFITICMNAAALLMNA